jgi:hypothetical protein
MSVWNSLKARIRRMRVLSRTARALRGLGGSSGRLLLERLEDRTVLTSIVDLGTLDNYSK